MMSHMKRSVLLLALAACMTSGPNAAVRARAQSPTSSSSQAALPSAERILARYRTAIGGEALIKKYKSRRATGRFDLPAQGIGGAFELVSAAPDRMRLKIELGGLGTMQRGFDGQVGWAIDPAIGPRVLSGAELDEVRHSADYYYDLHERSGYKSIAVLERAPFEGRDCFTVKLVRPSGLEVLEYYDAATGLMAGFRMSSTSVMGTVPGAVTIFGEYKDFGGLRTPTTARQRAMGIESVLTVSTIDYDGVPASAFAAPPEIAAILKP
jgi:hypothetical protein